MHKHIKLFSILLGLFLTFQLNAEEIVVAISSTPNNLVPFYSTDANSQNINRLLHLSLVDLNSEMHYVCNACESYSEAMVKGKHVVTFKLKSDLQFTNGDKVRAQDVYNSWKYFSEDKKINSAFMETFSNIEEIKLLSDYELSIVFKNFSLENVGNLGTLKIIKLTNTKYPVELENVIGAGQYVVTKASPLVIELKPRDTKRPTLIFKVVKDETTLALKLLNKEIDLSVASISPRKLNWLREKNNLLKVWELPSSNYIFLGLNQKDGKFSDWRVRKALSHLVPRNELLKYKLKNTAILSRGMFSPAFKDFYRERPIDDYNPILANQLLTSAGYSKNANGYFEINGKVFEIDWKVSNNKSSIETVEVIKDYFERNGIKVNITIQEWGTYMANFKAGKFDIVAGQWIGFAGPDMLKFVFHSENIPPKGGNRIRYNNKKFDTVVDMATNETGLLKRNKLYNDANDIINSDYAYINLWHPNVIWVGNKCLKHIQLEPTGSFISMPLMEKRCD